MRRSGFQATGRGRWLAPSLGCALLAVLACAGPAGTPAERQAEARAAGEAALAEGRYDEARTRLAEAVALAEEAGVPPVEQANTWTRLGRAARVSRHIPEAREAVDTALGILQALPPSAEGARAIVAAQLEAALLERDTGSLAAAERRARGLLALDVPPGAEPELAQAEHLLAELLTLRLAVDEARIHWRGALDRLRAVPDPDPELLGSALFRVAEAELAEGRPERAAALAEESRQVDVEDRRYRVGALLIEGFVHAQAGELPAARDKLVETLDVLREDPASDAQAAARAVDLALLLYARGLPVEEIAPELERAATVHEGAAPLPRMMLGLSLVRASNTLTERGEPTSAMALARAGTELIRGSTDELQPALVEAKLQLSRVHLALGEVGDAEEECDEAIALAEGIGPEASAGQVLGHLICGGIAEERGALEAAERHYREGLAIQEQTAAAPVPVESRLMLRVAALERDRGDTDAERTLLLRAVSLHGRDRSHPAFEAASRVALAGSYRRAGEPSWAFRESHRALELWGGGPVTGFVPQYLAALEIVAEAWLRQGRPREVELMLLGALARPELKGDAQARARGDLRSGLAVALGAQGRLEEARQAAAESVADLGRAPDVRPVELANGWNSLAYIDLQLGRLDDASESVERGLETLEDAEEGRTRAEVRARLLHNRARVASREEAWERAIEHYREADDAYREARLTRDRRYLQLLQDLAFVYGEAGRYEESADTGDRLIRAVRRLAPDHESLPKLREATQQMRERAASER